MGFKDNWNDVKKDQWYKFDGMLQSTSAVRKRKRNTIPRDDALGEN